MVKQFCEITENVSVSTQCTHKVLRKITLYFFRKTLCFQKFYCPLVTLLTLPTDSPWIAAASFVTLWVSRASKPMRFSRICVATELFFWKNRIHPKRTQRYLDHSVLWISHCTLCVLKANVSKRSTRSTITAHQMTCVGCCVTTTPRRRSFVCVWVPCGWCSWLERAWRALHVHLLCIHCPHSPRHLRVSRVQ